MSPAQAVGRSIVNESEGVRCEAPPPCPLPPNGANADPAPLRNPGANQVRPGVDENVAEVLPSPAVPAYPLPTPLPNWNGWPADRVFRLYLETYR